MNERMDHIDPATVLSRRALIDVVLALYDHREALTVLGGHAVIAVTSHLAALPQPDATQDGDLGVTPQLLANSPLLLNKMTELGFETARTDRPGIWSLIEQRDVPIHQRVTVDLIAPRAVAADNMKRQIRAARVGAHGKRSVSATEGTELSWIDRHLMVLHSFDGGPSPEVFIAGPTALLCSKAYKLHDRMNPKELARNRERLRRKDFADVYRLTHAISGNEAAEVFAESCRDSQLGFAIARGRQYLLELLDEPEMVAEIVAETWGDPDLESEIVNHIREWRSQFLS